MFSSLRNYVGQVSRPDVPVVFSVILLLVIGASCAIAQNPSPNSGTAQPNAQNMPVNTPACYLGSEGTNEGNFGFGGQSTPTAEMTGSASDFSQQGYSPYLSQQDYGSQQNINDLQGYGNYQPGAVQLEGQYPNGPGQPQNQYGPSQSGNMANQQAMPAAQIIQILQQNPSLLPPVRYLAGQQYEVDPSSIPDSGIYNCIQQDPGFRAEVGGQLAREGYAGTSLQRMGKARANRSAFRGNRPYRGYLRQHQQPSELRRLTPMPYPYLPSLRDLYSQEIPAGGRLRRFGSDVFEFGTGNINLLPMDLPVGPNYILGTGDNLVINIWGGQSGRLLRTVDRQGDIALPEAGTVIVSGLTIAQAQIAIQKALGTQFQDEHVELSLGRVRAVRVYVVGDVQRPGAYDVSSLSTPLNALYEAGGPTSRGSLRTLKLLRGSKLVEQIDLYDFLLNGVRPQAMRLEPGDTILVPPVGPQVAISGLVRRPAIYELKGKEDLKDVLNMAGGLLASADLREIRVERVIAHQRHTMLQVQITDGAKGEDQLPPFQVQDGDAIQVSPILPYNDQVVYLEGHVFKPGQYAWHEGMTVNDLLHSYQDVMPEPAAQAEIVRLVPPDLHPVTIPFNLPDMLIGNFTMTLQPFDTVEVFGRYQLDPPKVSIFGAVLRPGVYPMSQRMTIAGLVRMAGGFTRGAYRKEADLSDYVVRNGQRVIIGHRVVAIQKAMDGDKSADVLLQPGDVVGIRQMTGWNDIGSSVTISGEVKFAGTYGITDGERLSSVLKRAGGFRKDAYPRAAVLLRVAVRQLEQANQQAMIQRIETTTPTVGAGVTTTTQDQKNLLQEMQQQRQEVLASLRNHPPTGRLVIRISADISKWENTPADIVMRAGDRLMIPKRPDFVLVSGQVYNATGITFRPGKDAGWYLRQAGGPTSYANKKQIFILRANGSVVANNRERTIFEGGILSTRMQPGDSIIVPEKVIGGSQVWQNVIGVAQIATSGMLAGAFAGAW